MNAIVFVFAQMHTNPFFGGLPHRDIGSIVPSISHVLLFLNPAVTGLAYHAFIYERVLPDSVDSSSIFSLVGLAGQYMMYLILALKWITTAPIPWEKAISGSVPLPGLWFFYNLFGWIIVENTVFAGINGNLFRVARNK
ncbi:hypothetical protein PENSUB_4950 [Penicillium subrubescens]|jgi:hypothetical protein|uniref:Uncharacterized protein n=1 Tax=Penicillium subrubescens TaxID=1316194 RepID=A0A1Q5UB37_9EURO|nr:hypothetical protein PENSUB_4950 [Penicillium subrubescens]